MSEPTPFDPWSMTTEKSLEVRMDERQLMQYLAARDMTKRREEIVGSGFAVLEAVAACARYELIMPAWLSAEFRRRFNAVRFHRTASWDDEQAFGRPYPKGTHLRRLRNEELWPELCTIVRRLLEEDPSRPIDELLFDDASERLRNLKGIDDPRGLGRSECQRIYYANIDRYNALFSTPGNSHESPVIRRGR